LETRILKLEDTLGRAKVISQEEMAKDVVTILSKVKIRDMNRNSESEYTLVSAEESDFKMNKISTTSPVGKALLGKKVGQIVEIKVPAGLLKYEILDIQAAL
jgi:transcription elongation factor GreA